MDFFVSFKGVVAKDSGEIAKTPQGTLLSLKRSRHFRTSCPDVILYIMWTVNPSEMPTASLVRVANKLLESYYSGLSLSRVLVLLMNRETFDMSMLLP